jgi:hypothetical protein
MKVFHLENENDEREDEADRIELYNRALGSRIQLNIRPIFRMGIWGYQGAGYLRGNAGRNEGLVQSM